MIDWVYLPTYHLQHVTDQVNITNLQLAGGRMVSHKHCLYDVIGGIECQVDRLYVNARLMQFRGLHNAYLPVGNFKNQKLKWYLSLLM